MPNEIKFIKIIISIYKFVEKEIKNNDLKSENMQNKY